MNVWPQKVVSLNAGLAFLLALVAGVVVAFPLEFGWWAVPPAVLAGFVTFLFSSWKYLRRRRLLRGPFPEPWRKSLESCVPFYRRLDVEGKGRFEVDVRIFMAEQRIYGPRGEPVPDEQRVLVAASAAMLGHGHPSMEWPRVRDVVIYPRSFDEDYAVDAERQFSGMVHASGPILFSGPSLTHGFCVERDGSNVGLHEMAHVLDFADGAADGVPAGVDWVATAPWLDLVADRLVKVRRGRMRRVLRNYAGTNEAEFFAVAVEVFFERPEELAKRDRELFDMLLDYFNVDPRTGKLVVTRAGA